MATGAIITAVAELLIHMDRKAVAPSMPATRRRGVAPAAAAQARPTRLWRPLRSMAAPRTKPPRNRKMTGSA